MRISVTGDNGECFSYETSKDSLCLAPSRAEAPGVVSALEEATEFLRPFMAAPGERVSIWLPSATSSTETI